MLGKELTHWTIRMALLCYVAYGVGQLASPAWAKRHHAWLRVIWTMGCIFFCLHVYCAFAFYHHFSHQAAFDTTAEETKAMLGTAFGEGIYFSYIFLAVWVLDCVRQWLPPTMNRLPAWLSGCVHGYLFFIAINGALVFEGGVTRWFGIPLTLLLIILVIRRAVRQDASVADASSAASLSEAGSP